MLQFLFDTDYLTHIRGVEAKPNPVRPLRKIKSEGRIRARRLT